MPNLNSTRCLSAAAIAGAAVAAYVALIRPWHLKWGATPEEIAADLPGDELTPGCTWSATHAITIDAPPSEVWPWIVQLGQDKAGFYSYSWLENAIGCHMGSSDHIVPEYQHIAAGDSIWLHPKAPPLPVEIVEPERALVLGSNTSAPGTWGFYLRPEGECSTRLIVRGRSRIDKNPISQIGHYGLFEPAHFIMERKMMLTIKSLATQPRHGSSSHPYF
jgi:hypothetical protein